MYRLQYSILLIICLGIFVHSAEAHLSAEDIIAYVQARMPEVHKSTIYRTLELLEETGCIFRSELDAHSIYHHAEEGHHHHLICSRCGKTIECDEALFASIKSRWQRNMAFALTSSIWL